MIPTGPHRVWIAAVAGALLLSAVGCEPETRVQTQRSTEVRRESSSEHFAVGLQQDGRKIPIRNNVAFLKKEPFSFVLLFSDQPGVLVNVQSRPDLLERARRRADLTQRAALTRTMKQWKAPILRASEDSWDYWYHYGLSQDMTKFDDVQRIKLRDGSGVMACKKVIQQYQPSRDAQTVPIEEMEEDRLHLVFVFAPAQVGGGRTEVQREWLTIVFRD